MQRVEDRIETTNSGISYVKVKPSECFAWGGACICNHCGEQFINEPMFLSFLYGDLYCHDCFEEMTSNSRLSKEELKEDLKYQDEMALEWYKSYLGE